MRPRSASRLGPPASRRIDWILRNFKPLAAGGRSFDGVQYPLIFQSIFEIWPRRLAFGDRLQEVVHRMRERVLVADDVTGGHQAETYGCLASVTEIVEKPLSGPDSR